MESEITKGDAYIAQRSGNYDFREARYKAVADLMNLVNTDTVFDIGACMTEFDFYLRTQLQWRGRYIPIDYGIDGTDLDKWSPPRQAEWFVGIEILEHLHHPDRLLDSMHRMATKGVIITTPNPAVVDVIACDIDHVTAIEPQLLRSFGMSVREVNLFGKERDTLLGVWLADE